MKAISKAKGSQRFFTGPNSLDICFGYFCSTMLGSSRMIYQAFIVSVLNILSRSHIFQIVKIVIQLVPISVINLKAIRTWANKSIGYKLVNQALSKWVYLTIPSTIYSTLYKISCLPAFTIIGCSSHSPIIGNFVVRIIRNEAPFFKEGELCARLRLHRKLTPFVAIWWVVKATPPVSIIAQGVN